MIIHILKRIKKDGFISLYVVFVFSVSFFFLFIPPIVFSNNIDSILMGVIISNSTEADRWKAYFYILIMLGTIVLSNRVSIVIKKNYTSIPPSYTSLTDSNDVKQIIHDVSKPWFIILLIIGLVGFMMLVSQLGLRGMVEMSGSARGASGVLTDSNAVVGYGKIFAKCIIASLSPGLLLYQLNKKGIFRIVLIIIFLMSFLLEIFIAGKTNFILFLAPFAIYFFTGNAGKVKTKYLVILSILVLVFVFLLDDWFYYLSNGVAVSTYRTSWTANDYFLRYIREFIYPYANLLNVDKMNQEFGYRFFIDIPATVINFIPAALLGGFKMTMLYKEVSQYYQSLGSRSVDGVPSDYLNYAFRQAGLFSVFIITFIRIQLFKVIDNEVKNVKHNCDIIGINGNHFITCCYSFGFISVLMEPHLAFKSQPILICSVIIAMQISNRLKRLSNMKKIVE